MFVLRFILPHYCMNDEFVKKLKLAKNVHKMAFMGEDLLLCCCKNNFDIISGSCSVSIKLLLGQFL